MSSSGVTHGRSAVALLAEGVDRNILEMSGASTGSVALLAEGVDRNEFGGAGEPVAGASPSSRRAWIEIQPPI